MDVIVRNAAGLVTEREKAYASEKLGRLDRYFHQAHSAEMVVRDEKLKRHVEITIFADGMSIRGEQNDASVLAAIDRLHDKLEARLRKFKGRLVDRHRRNGSKSPKGLTNGSDAEPRVAPMTIAEQKHFLLKPMSREEASLQMEMAQRTFYAFKNESTGIFEILYKLKNGKYGVMHPEG